MGYAELYAASRQSQPLAAGRAMHPLLTHSLNARLCLCVSGSCTPCPCTPTGAWGRCCPQANSVFSGGLGTR
jgi:hypothetical protein